MRFGMQFCSACRFPARVKIAALVFMLLISTCLPVQATEPTVVNVGLKALTLLEEKAFSSAAVAVIFDSDNPASKTDAESIMKYINEKSTVILPETAITAKLVNVKDIANISGFKMAFLAEGISNNNIDTICNAANKAQMLTISTNTNCVRVHKCVLSIETKPQIEIYYSVDAAESAHIKFDSALLMLVKPL